MLRVVRFVIAIATLALLLPGLAALAQDPLETDDPSPATRHAQVIAHGVAPMPADEIAWRLTVDRAQPPTRADADERPAGFILADKGVVALVDQEGRRLARIAPGEAVWTEPGVARAVIGIERKAPDYYDIALVPATELAEGDPVLIGGAPFVAPTGDTFDVDLIRDVLNRAEESVVSTGTVAGASPGHEWYGLRRIEQRPGRNDDRRRRSSCRRRGDHRGQPRARGVRGGAHRARSSCAGRCRSLPINGPRLHRHPARRRTERVRHDLRVTLPDRVCGKERRRGLRRSRERSRVQPDVRRCRNRYRPGKRRRRHLVHRDRAGSLQPECRATRGLRDLPGPVSQRLR